MKFLVRGEKQGPIYDVIFQSSSKQFQSNILRPNNNSNFCTSSHCIFKRSNPVLQLIFHNSGIFISFMTSLSPNWIKTAESSKSFVEGDRKIKTNIWWNFEVTSLFLRSRSLKTAVFITVMTSLTQNWVKKGPNLEFMYQWWWKDESQ